MIKEPEDEAFEEIEKAQQQRKLLVDKGCAERGCMGYDDRDGDKPTAMYTKDVFLQLIKELRPAIKPLEGMGKGKTTEEWFDILVKDIEEKL